MSQTTLYFATNRKHEGPDHLHPTSYGKAFSSDGMQNLRFGKVTLEVDEEKVKDFLTEVTDGYAGNGEGLSSYLEEQSGKAAIMAYEDKTPLAKELVPREQNASTHMFLELKEKMEKGADVVVYIHGYNVNWHAAVGSATALQYMLNRDRTTGLKETIVVLFSWPSDGSVMPFAAYRSDRGDAQGSGVAVGRAILKLHEFLRTLRRDAKTPEQRLCGQEIHLLCHSMGNYVLQNALPKIIEHAAGSTMPRVFKHIFLCAPDVDDDVLEKGKAMERLHELCANVTVYFNTGDVAMYISDYTKGNPERLGHAGSAHPFNVHNKVH